MEYHKETILIADDDSTADPPRDQASMFKKDLSGRQWHRRGLHMIKRAWLGANSSSKATMYSAAESSRLFEIRNVHILFSLTK